MKKVFTVFCIMCLFLVQNIFAQADVIQEELSFDSSKIQFAMSSPDYMVTAGDIYLLSYAVGSNAVKYSIPVDSTYKIKISNLATINAKGKTFLALKEEVESIVNSNFPLGGVNFVLTQPSLFQILIKGEVTSTTTKNAWALTRLNQIIGGVSTPYTSTRIVTVISENGKKNTYDLFKFHRNADFSQNPYIRPGDTIILGRYDRKVTIEGSVERPGTYELLKGENFKTLLEKYANGLSQRADTNRIEITRNKLSNEVANQKFYLTQKDITDSFELFDDDSIFIHNFNELAQYVFIEGAIISEQQNTKLISSTKIPLSYIEYEDYASLFRRHRSLFSESSDLENAYIVRKDEKLPININTILYNRDFSSGIIPEENDLILIPFKQAFVNVAGAVHLPGRYPYIPDRTWEYYIGLAGGFDISRNSGNKIKIVSLTGEDVSNNIFINPEDTITAETNSFLYFFNTYSPLITTVLSLATTTISLFAIIGK